MSIAVPSRSMKGEYVLDPGHSQIAFVARHAMASKVRGTFKEFSATPQSCQPHELRGA